jgi:two-component system alkaline phosphatase synthesis response regulator PhoP
MQPSLLLIGNDPGRLDEMAATIDAVGCAVQICRLTEGSGRSPGPRPDLLVVDLTSGLSPQTGARVIKDLVGEAPAPSLAALTHDQIAQFEPRMGFDDFIVWPCPAAEVQARVRLALAASESPDPVHIVRAGGLLLDKAGFRAYLEDRLLALTYKEYELLLFLMTNRDRVLTREAILNRVWGYDYYGGARTVDVHIRRLRTKIEDRNHSFIETVRNVGYRFHPQ